MQHNMPFKLNVVLIMFSHQREVLGKSSQTEINCFMWEKYFRDTDCLIFLYKSIVVKMLMITFVHSQRKKKAILPCKACLIVFL